MTVCAKLSFLNLQQIYFYDKWEASKKLRTLKSIDLQKNIKKNLDSKVSTVGTVHVEIFTLNVIHMKSFHCIQFHN